MNATAKAQILPPPLKPGDTIGIFAPAGPVADWGKSAAGGLRLLQEAGFKLRLQTDLADRRQGYLAGSDRQRAAELHDLWRDPEVKALLALRGGYGCLRLLNLLEWELLTEAPPKLLIGFSDLTVLHAACRRRTGLITLHGPMLATLASGDRESNHRFFLALAGQWPPISRPPGWRFSGPGQPAAPWSAATLPA